MEVEVGPNQVSVSLFHGQKQEKVITLDDVEKIVVGEEWMTFYHRAEEGKKAKVSKYKRDRVKNVFIGAKVVE